jgi:dienelactone hydrolase
VIIGSPAAMVDAYVGGLKDARAVEAARIPVDKIRGPVLLFSGADDRLWPSTQMGAEVIKQLDKANFPYRYEHWSYKDVGHGLGLPYLHTTEINQGTLLLGGTPQATAAANVDAWGKLLDFLSSAFSSTE